MEIPLQCNADGRTKANVWYWPLNQPLAGDNNNYGFYFDEDEDTKAEYSEDRSVSLDVEDNEKLKVEKKQLAALLQVNCVSNVDSITYRK